MTQYAINKQRARDKAIMWQSMFGENSYSWGELLRFSDYFTKVGKRYGLLREFRENGII